MAITSLTITYTGNNIWMLTDNDGNDYIEAYYTGGSNNDFINVKSKNGGNIVNQIPVSIINYVDLVDPDNNFTPSTALHLITYLKGVGFFDVSSGGEGATPALKGLEDALFANYFGRRGQAVVIDDSELGFTTMELPEGITQNNIPEKIYFNYLKGETSLQMLNRINAIPAYTISETTSVVLYIGKEMVQTGLFTSPTGNIVKYMLFNKGKGTYGTTGGLPINPLTWDDLELIEKTTATITDIESDPTTQLVDYGDIEEQTISEWLNAEDPARIIQSQADGYTLFKGTIDGEPMSYLWVGEAGEYGLTELQSTDADFQILEDTAPTNNFVPYTGAIEDIELAGLSYKSQVLIGTLFKRFLASSTSIVMSEFDSASPITGKSVTVTPGQLIINQSTSNGATQASILLTIEDFTKALFKVLSGSLVFDLPSGQTAKYKIAPTLSTSLDIPNKGYIDAIAAAKADLVSGKVPASQLPSYVDDIEEYADAASFPVAGESGKLYLALDTELLYRWTGSIYAEISPSVLQTLQQVTDNGNVTNNSIGVDYGVSGATFDFYDGEDLISKFSSSGTVFGFENGSAPDVSFSSVGLTDDRSYVLPNGSGTIALEGNTIPLTGTESGSPVTGDIQLDAINGDKSILGAYGSFVKLKDDGVVEINAGGGSNVVLKEIEFNNDGIQSKGNVYLPPLNSFFYVQKFYVDSNFPKLKHHSETDVTLTGTTTITILDSHLIPANTLSDGSITLEAIIEHVGTLGGFGLYFYLNDSLSTVGAVQLARFIGGSTNLRAPFMRTFSLRADNTLKGYAFNDSAATDLATSNTVPSSTAWNRTTTPKYLIIAGNPSNSGDTIICKSFKIKHEPTVA